MIDHDFSSLMASEVMSSDDILEIPKDGNDLEDFEIIFKDDHFDEESHKVSKSQNYEDTSNEDSQVVTEEKSLIDILKAQIVVLNEQIEHLRDDSKPKSVQPLHTADVLSEISPSNKKIVRFEDVVDIRQHEEIDVIENCTNNAHTTNYTDVNVERISNITLDVYETPDKTRETQRYMHAVENNNMVHLPSHGSEIHDKSIDGDVMEETPFIDTFMDSVPDMKGDIGFAIEIDVDNRQSNENKPPKRTFAHKYWDFCKTRKNRKTVQLLNGSLQAVLEPLAKQIPQVPLRHIGVEAHSNANAHRKKSSLLYCRHDKKIPRNETMINESWLKILVAFVAMSLFVVGMICLPLLLMPI